MRRGAKLPCQRIEFLEKDAVGEVRFLALQKSTIENCEYNYEIEGKVVTDPILKPEFEKERNGEHAEFVPKAWYKN